MARSITEARAMTFDLYGRGGIAYAFRALRKPALRIGVVGLGRHHSAFGGATDAMRF
jgi:hypothetical protein